LQREPDERNGWIADAERWIRQIHGVRDCRIEVGQDDKITGVHVVSDAVRDSMQVASEVASLLRTRLGADVPQQQIGVVQIVDNDRPITDDGERSGPRPKLNAETDRRLEPLPAVLQEEPLAPRIQCRGVGVLASELSIRAEVELQLGAVEARGTEEGPNHSGSDLQLIAKAAVAAVCQLLDEPVLLSLSDVRVLELAQEPVVLIAVELVEGRRSQRLFGTCPARHNRQQAVVFAVLDALNRRLMLMNFKTGEVAG
jgi:hypothetical protein